MDMTTRRQLAGRIRDVTIRCPECGAVITQPTQSKAMFAMALHVRRTHG